MKYVSMSPTAAWDELHEHVGAASRSRVPTMDPSRSRRGPRSTRRIVGSGASTSLRASFSITSARARQRPVRLLPVGVMHVDDARATGSLVVCDVTLDEAHGLPAFHEAPDGPELGGPHGLQEIDLESMVREGLASASVLA